MSSRRTAPPGHAPPHPSQAIESEGRRTSTAPAHDLPLISVLNAGSPHPHTGPEKGLPAAVDLLSDLGIRRHSGFPVPAPIDVQVGKSRRTDCQRGERTRSTASCLWTCSWSPST